MTEDIKQRFYRAIQAAISILDQPKDQYKIEVLDGKPFHLQASDELGVRKIRIVLDEIKEEDEKLVREETKLPEKNCKKLIWCKEKDKRGFISREID